MTNTQILPSEFQIWPQTWDFPQTFASCGDRTSQTFPLIWWTWPDLAPNFASKLDVRSKPPDLFIWKYPPWGIWRLTLQARLLIMALGNGPMQDWACWMIATPLLEGFVQFYLGRDLVAHERSLSFTYRRPAESWSSLGQMYFGKRRASWINLFWSGWILLIMLPEVVMQVSISSKTIPPGTNPRDTTSREQKLSPRDNNCVQKPSPRDRTETQKPHPRDLNSENFTNISINLKWKALWS